MTLSTIFKMLKEKDGPKERNNGLASEYLRQANFNLDPKLDGAGAAEQACGAQVVVEKVPASSVLGGRADQDHSFDGIMASTCPCLAGHLAVLQAPATYFQTVHGTARWRYRNFLSG